METGLLVSNTGNGNVDWLNFLEWWKYNKNGLLWWLYNFKFSKNYWTVHLTVFQFWYVNYISVKHKICLTVYLCWYSCCAYEYNMNYSFYFLYSHEDSQMQRHFFLFDSTLISLYISSQLAVNITASLFTLHGNYEALVHSVYWLSSLVILCWDF